MLFMVIEHFKNGDPEPIGKRFSANGRMLPDGVTYHASWLEEATARCFQVMEAPDRDALQVWVNRWDDLMDFEIVPVQTSNDYWAKFRGTTSTESRGS